MKQAKAKPDAKPARKARSEGPAALADLNAVREQIRNLVGSEAVQMVESTIAEANSGHYAAMKYLFEMTGLYPATIDAEDAAPDDSLAMVLLRHLGISGEPKVEAVITKDSGGSSSPSSDALE